MLGVVEQEPILFADSIGANIAYGLPIPSLPAHDHHHHEGEGDHNDNDKDHHGNRGGFHENEHEGEKAVSLDSYTEEHPHYEVITKAAKQVSLSHIYI